MLRALAFGLAAVIGGGAAAFAVWDDAYPPHVRNDVVVAAVCVGAAAAGLVAAVRWPLPAWAILLLVGALPLAFVVEFGATLSYWEEAGVRCEPPDPVLTHCRLVTTASDAAFGGFAACVGGLALGSLVRTSSSRGGVRSQS